jgi:hypothetical protein
LSALAYDRGDPGEPVAGEEHLLAPVGAQLGEREHRRKPSRLTGLPPGRK